MAQKANFFKLGLFVIVTFGLGVLFLIIFGAGEFLKKELLAETCFNESVQGLSIGSEVKYKGIKIGTVKEIKSAAQVYNTQSDFVLVIISLEDDISMGQTGKNARQRVEKAVADGLTVKLSFKGLTGVAYLETDYNSTEQAKPLDVPWTPKTLYIPSRQSSIKQYGDALNQILDNLAAINIKGITVDIESLLKTLDKKATDFDTAAISNQTASLIAELKQTSQKIGQALESEKMDRLISDAQTTFSDIRGIVHNSGPKLDSAFQNFKEAAQSTKSLTTDIEKKLGPRITSLSDNLDQLTKNMAAISDMLENMVWLNSDKMNLILENLETSSENLKQMSKDLKQYPGRLLFQEAPEKFESGKKDQ